MRSTGSSGSPSPFSPYLTGGPASTPVARLTPTAPAGTPAGLTPNAPAGTPVGTNTPNPGARSPRANDRNRFLGMHTAITGEALLANLGARLSTRAADADRRQKATEEGSDSLDRLVGNDGDNEVAEYEKLKDEPDKLAEKIAKLVFGSVVDPTLDPANERLKEVFELGFLESHHDRKSVQKKAFQEVKLLDGGGVVGVTGQEDDNVGAASLLEPESRTRLSPATQSMLNMLEHGQWTPQVLASKSGDTTPGELSAEPGGTPSQVHTREDHVVAGLSSLNLAARTESRNVSPLALARDDSRSPSPNALEDKKSE
jgi:hypothetical protein